MLSTQSTTFASGKKIYSLTNVANNHSSRDWSGIYANFEPIALVEHQGHLSQDGGTQGHYICDLEDKETLQWFRTNDNQNPVQIELKSVTQKPVVILYKKIH